MTKRRYLPTPARIEEIIAAGQRRGLTPCAVVMHSDGTTEIRYADGGANPTRRAARSNIGWEDL